MLSHIGRVRRHVMPPSSPAAASTGSAATSESAMHSSPSSGIRWDTTRNDTSVYERAVLQQISLGRPRSTRNVNDPKIQEYYDYCLSLYGNSDPYYCNLDDNKVFNFMFYQSMREPRQQGGKKNRTRLGFDRADFDSIMQQYRAWMATEDDMNATSSSPPPEPENSLGPNSFAQYKSCLKWIYRDQVARHVTSLTWDQIWTLKCENLQQLVKTRTPANKKKNYHEKVDYEFAPYTVVEDFPKIETETWVSGYGSVRSASAWLRHRYCLLQSTSGILRCESLFKAELSDMLGITVQHEHDPHPLYVLVMQIATGKY